MLLVLKAMNHASLQIQKILENATSFLRVEIVLCWITSDICFLGNEKVGLQAKLYLAFDQTHFKFCFQF